MRITLRSYQYNYYFSERTDTRPSGMEWASESCWCNCMTTSTQLEPQLGLQLSVDYIVVITILKLVSLNKVWPDSPKRALINSYRTIVTYMRPELAGLYLN